MYDYLICFNRCNFHYETDARCTPGHKMAARNRYKIAVQEFQLTQPTTKPTKPSEIGKVTKVELSQTKFVSHQVFSLTPRFIVSFPRTPWKKICRCNFPYLFLKTGRYLFSCHCSLEGKLSVWANLVSFYFLFFPKKLLRKYSATLLTSKILYLELVFRDQWAAKTLWCSNWA